MSKREDVCVWSKDEMVCEEMKRLRAKVTELEAENNHLNSILDETCLMLGIAGLGETADSITKARDTKREGECGRGSMYVVSRKEGIYEPET